MAQSCVQFLLEQFRNPDDTFRPAIMWFWNGDLDLEEMTHQLKGFREKGIYDFFVHPLSGAKYEYLSEEFFGAVRHCVAVAKELGLHYWIYDEFNWPSGIAGGTVIREHPEYRAKTLNHKKFSVSEGSGLICPFLDGRFLRAEATPKDGSFERVDITDRVEVIPCGDGFSLRFRNCFCTPVSVSIFSVALQNYVTPASRYQNFAPLQSGYIDPLNRDAIRGFIDATHERYKEAVGEEFGKTVKGVFTDEICAGFSLDLGSGRVPWTEGLEDLYRARYGQDLIPYLYALTDLPRTGTEKQVRYRFWQLITDLFRDCHVGQVADWCKKEGLEYTGHYYGDESPTWWQYQSGDIFELLKGLSIPGMDSIFSIPRIEDGNFNLAAVLLASCGRFFEKDRLLCETFSLSYALRFPEMRRVVNRLLTRGINMIQYMGAYYSSDMGRKLNRTNFNGSNPLSRHYDRFGDYVARIQALSAATKPCGRVLLVSPMAAISSAVDGHSVIFENYYYLHEKHPEGKLDRTLDGLSEALLRLNVEFDLCSDRMAADVTCGDGVACLYGGEYELVILPEPENTTSQVISMAERLSAAGVKLLWINGLPKTAVDSGEEISPEKYTDSVCVYQNFESLESADPRWEALLAPHVSHMRTMGIRHDGGIYTGLRQRGDARVVFLSNDRDCPVTASVEAEADTVFLDAESGLALPVVISEGRATLEFDPYGMIIALTGKGLPELPYLPLLREGTGISLDEDGVSFPEGNLLPLHWSRTDGKGEELICNQLPGNLCLKGGELSFRTRILAKTLPEDLSLLIETDSLCSCKLNGEELLDTLQKDFRWGGSEKSVSVSHRMTVGENLLEIRISVPKNSCPFSAPFACLRGNFSASVGEIRPTDGLSEGYERLFGDVILRFRTSLSAAEAKRYTVFCAESKEPMVLSVNGALAGRKLWGPFRFDCSDFLREGENFFELRLTLPTHNAFYDGTDRIAVGLS